MKRFQEFRYTELAAPLKCLCVIPVLLALFSLPALALHGGVLAQLQGDLPFRTGPGAAYTRTDTVPMDATIAAIDYEEGADGVWIRCDFAYQGGRARGYIEADGVALESSVYAAELDYLQRRLLDDADVFASPDVNAELRASLAAGTTVAFLEFDGDYCFVEYSRGTMLERGYILAGCFMVDQDEFEEYFPDNDGDTLWVVSTTANMYAEPSDDSALLYAIPYDSCVSFYFDEPLYGDYQSVYYGGLHGYCHYRDLNDLRGLPWTD